MNYNFDELIDRRPTDSYKWAKYRGKDIIPMWIADMDFRCCSEILDALHKRVNHGVFGYALPQDRLYKIIANMLLQKYGWQIDTSWIVWLPGLVPGLNVACRAFSQPSDEIVTFTPVYPPFLEAPDQAGRRLLSIPLKRDDLSYTFDLELFEQKISPQTRLLILCNPHNPVGKMYSKKELNRLAEICLKHNIIICSDEIHCDIILNPDKQHIPIATISPETAQNTITLMSAGKTYNIPGLNCGFAIIPNDNMRQKFNQTREGIVPYGNALGYAACEAAYDKGEPWRKALMKYLSNNRDTVYDYVNNQIPYLSALPMDATFLAWIDARELITRLNIKDPVVFFEKAGVGLSDGRFFRGDGYVRLNFGCPRQLLIKALERMKKAVIKHSLT